MPLDHIRPLGFANRLHRARFTGNVSFQSAIGEHEQQPVAPQLSPLFLPSRLFRRGRKNSPVLRIIAIPERHFTPRKTKVSPIGDRAIAANFRED